MNWQKIDPDNLPEGKVLVNLQNLFMIGILRQDVDGTIFCEQSRGGMAFANPDYYILLSELADTLPDTPLDDLEN